ncbi:MAG: methyltransferase domain-containing protein [Pseudomonadota bacterium]|nr:methyltransferase domain-containing protein [Pseudomonadota bacterium]
MLKTNSRFGPVIDKLNFLSLWVRRPQSMGAIAPSSHNLASAIAREVDYNLPGLVVELGAGTGSITAALIENASDPGQIVVVEREASLCRLLRKRFPKIRVIRGDARELKRLIARADIGPVKAVVSGLPLLNMARRQRSEILDQCFAIMPPGGVMVQFTYGSVAPLPRSVARQSGIAGERAGWVLRNLPPAAIWRYSRDETADGAPFH